MLGLRTSSTLFELGMIFVSILQEFKNSRAQETPRVFLQNSVTDKSTFPAQEELCWLWNVPVPEFLITVLCSMVLCKRVFLDVSWYLGFLISWSLGFLFSCSLTFLVPFITQSQNSIPNIALHLKKMYIPHTPIIPFGGVLVSTGGDQTTSCRSSANLLN